MCRSVFRLFFSVLAIIFCFLGLTLLLLRAGLLHSENYKNALADSGIYNSVTQLAKANLAQNDNTDPELTLTPEMTIKEILAQPEFSKFLTNRILQTMLVELEAQQILQDTVEQNLDNILSWLSSQEDVLYIYFPREQLVSILDTDKLAGLVFDAFLAYAGKDDLPSCVLDDYFGFLVSYEDFASLRLDQITCNSIILKTFAQEVIIDNLPQEKFNFVEQILNSNDLALSEHTPITNLLQKPGEQKDTPTVQSFDESSARIRKAIFYTLIIAWAIIILGLIFTVCAQFFAAKNIGNIGIIAFSVGLGLLTLNFIVPFVTQKYLIQRLDLGKIDLPLELFSSEQRVDMETSIENAFNLTLQNVFGVHLRVGIILIIVGITMILLSALKKLIVSKTKNKERALISH